MIGHAEAHCPTFHANRTSDEFLREVVDSVAGVMKLLLAWNVVVAVVVETLLPKAIVLHLAT